MTSQYEGWNGGVDSDEDEAQEDFYKSKQATLFMIEATSTMLAPMLDPPSATPLAPSATQPSVTQALSGFKSTAKSKMEVTLRTAYAMLKRKVISAPKDMIGILIFNTETTKGVKSYNKDNCYLLMDLAQPDANNIRFLKDLLQECEENPGYLATLFEPSTKQNVVGDAFGVCSSIFRSRAPKLSNKNIFLITDNDDPVDGNEQLTDVAVNKRRDLNDTGYGLQPFLIPPSPGVEFDVEKFYERVITMDRDDDEQVPTPIVQADLAAALEYMVANMRCKEAVKRSSFQIPFIISEGIFIGINGYQLVGEEKKKSPVKVDLDTQAGDEVVSKTIYKDAETGGILNPKQEIKKYFQIGKTDSDSGTVAKKIFFDEGEVRHIKTLGSPPSLKLLGFKPRSEGLKFHETVKHSYFLYPNEDTYSGSTRTFSSLLQSMVKKDLVGFAVLLARVSARPQIVILIPQPEKLNENGVIEIPNGIHVCQLPFADDIRPIGFDSVPSVMSVVDDQDPDLAPVEAAKKIIKYYTKRYIPEMVPNPALNYHYETLAAIALQEELPEAIDKAKPAYLLMDQRIGKHIAALKATVPEGQVDYSMVLTSTKKRKIEEKPESSEDIAEFAKTFIKYGSTLRAAQLKEGLKLLNLKQTGNKSDLVDRIKEGLIERGLMKDEGGEDSEDEKPRKKKSKSKGKKKKHECSEDDMDMDRDADTEEEEKPKTSKGNKKVVIIDDDSSDDNAPEPDTEEDWIA